MDLSRKLFYYRSKSTKSPSCIQIPGRPVWPVRPTGQTGRCCQAGYMVQTVRPLSSTGQTGLFDQCQFWSSTYAPLFFGDASMPKNKPLDQNCLRTMINIHRPFFCSKGNKIYRSYLASSSSWWRNNLLRSPYLFYGCRPCWYNLLLLFHRLFLAPSLQPHLLGAR